MIQPEKIVCQVAGDTTTHTHDTLQDLALCAKGRGLLVVVARTTMPPKAPATGAATGASDPRSAPAATPAPATEAPSVKNPDARPTARQLGFISSLGGSWRDAAMENRGQASALIKQLNDAGSADAFKLPTGSGFEAEEWELYPMEKNWRQGHLPDYWATPDTWEAEFTRKPADASYPKSYAEPAPAPKTYVEPPAVPVREYAKPKSKIEKLVPLLDRVPDGYFAVDLGDSRGYKFIRISTVASGRRKGCRKVQTIHGDMLEDAWFRWPSGSITVLKPSVEDLMIAVITDHIGAMRKYSQKVGRCCRCAKRLTDDRSRHYSIGPECEKYLPGVIHLVDMENGYTYAEKH